MVLRRKLRFWFVFVAVVLVVGVVLPAITQFSWSGFMTTVVSDYNEAAERAASYGEEDDDDEEDETNLQPMTVTLDDDAIDYAGVETIPVSKKLFFSELMAYAKVVDTRDLLRWRSRINQLQSTIRVAQVGEQAAKQELERLRKLANNTGSVASKNVNYADASWQEARANLQAARFQLEDAKTELLQGWGNPIASWVLDKPSKEFDRIVSRQDTLILVTLPVGASLTADVSMIRVSREGDRDSARKAYYVSPAYLATQQIQGETYYFRISTGKLRLGMRLDAWIPKNDEPKTGFHIPEQAIVWYAGQPWTYIQQDEATFKRRALADGDIVVGGIFIESGFEAGDALVISGSQMLLAEEFRWQIHDEDDD
ncbi:efflux RND transporter periplasmic adaptor subunit [Methylophaga thiooxydans]|uniref:RND efflux pump membrane fusion protein barrel-sandwich domain-containing protein n=1 Tax=Methylophaga thiooxydans DMS010 TaxID=637616 RepID=C0N1L2_9GAMM|nr:hypothetical protein [Methylophaga thiooxydans]EEF81345.1 hypothetical protein MDMS009_14 [Methylophaga thiooxydans DMS010]